MIDLTVELSRRRSCRYLIENTRKCTYALICFAVAVLIGGDLIGPATWWSPADDHVGDDPDDHDGVEHDPDVFAGLVADVLGTTTGAAPVMFKQIRK
jgi:hypothetical protein